jgi:prolipoprotein diacylglyceryltransferase
MNHEIYGGPTSMPWGFRFVDNINQYMQGAEPVFTQPCHPTQLYEALCYLVVFALCMYLYWRRNAQERPGFLLGVFLIGIFGSRFFIEFLKNVQEQWEIGLRQSIGLDQGQMLSIPFVIAGIWLIVRAMRRPREELEYPNRFSDEKKDKK